MMLNNQDEIAEFDQQLGSLLRGLDRVTNQLLASQIRTLMANLFFHDFAEWNSDRGRWVIPDFSFEAFDGDDEQRVRSVASACITILKTNGSTGSSALMKAGREYLRNRGVDTSPVIVNVNEIAAIIGIQSKNIPTSKKAEWGEPVAKGVRSKPATYYRDKILPHLERQWPDKPWSNL